MPSIRTTPTVRVTCGDCGGSFELSRRNELEHERRGMPHRCGRCRHPGAGLSPAAIARARRWWLDRYSLEELQAWPPL